MQQRAEATRRALLEAAARLFEERGYAKTSMSDVGALSGHTSGAIYFHYASKEQLAQAVVEEHVALWRALIGRHIEADAPALQRLVSLSFAVARALRENIVVRAGARLWHERVAISRHLPPPYLGWVDAARQLLAQAHRDGELAADVDLTRAVRAIVCALFSLHAMATAYEERQAVESHLTDLWRMLLPSLQGRADPDATLRAARALLELRAEEPGVSPGRARERG